MRPPPRLLPRLASPARPSPWTRIAAATAQILPFPQPSRTLGTTPRVHHNPSATTHSSPSSSTSSVNETEISHFSALASSWWDPHGPSRPLHLMNPLRHDFIRACLSSSSSRDSTSPTTPTGLRYLDVGCGGGIFAESAARLPTTHSVTAIDPSPTILAVARAHAKRDPFLLLPHSSSSSSSSSSNNNNNNNTGEPRLTYLNATIETLALPARPADRFDVVSVFEVVEHVDYPAAFLDRVGEFVRPGGWLVLSTIARTWTSWLTTKLVAEDLLGVVPRGTHDWDKYINEGELRAYFEGKGGLWGPPRVMGVVYVPGLGWKEVRGSEKVGNYFFGVQRVG
ncbi:dde887ca-73b0-4fb8-9a62-4f3b90a6d0d9 [Thermothielavioides terrestris]|uniref:Ubiquinone biosynthesis O-methyltransferase, mitochondrial n=1 Tax=Thermothielavioides terrestris TaxID=2587410 RepID=A0A3S4D5I0_9PEZI|nr:dde887ca-73b0-4fb8-9a62-4f3b90a6d0d9 [Thermothielavioides terrestris]